MNPTTCCPRGLHPSPQLPVPWAHGARPATSPGLSPSATSSARAQHLQGNTGVEARGMFSVERCGRTAYLQGAQKRKKNLFVFLANNNISFLVSGRSIEIGGAELGRRSAPEAPRSAQSLEVGGHGTSRKGWQDSRAAHVPEVLLRESRISPGHHFTLPL